MAQQYLTSLLTDQSRALLFTDARGHTVFVDANFVRLLRRPETETLVGTPFYKIMGIERDMATTLLREISQNGMIDQRQLELRDARFPAGQEAHPLSRRGAWEQAATPCQYCIYD